MVFAMSKLLGVRSGNNDDELRYNMAVYASQQTQIFLDSLNSESVMKKVKVLSAQAQNKIRYDQPTRSYLWHTGTVIMSHQIEQDPLEAIVDYSFTPQGQDAFKRIDSLLNPGKDKLADAVSGAKADLPELNVQELSTLEMVKKGLEYGILVKNGPWIQFEGNSIDRGEEKTAEKLEADAGMKAEIKKQLEAATS